MKVVQTQQLGMMIINSPSLSRGLPRELHTLSAKTKFALATAVLLWASAFVGIRAGLQDYSPEGLALLRYIVASLCMGIIFWQSSSSQKINFVDTCLLLLVGAIGIGVYNITLNYGEISISSGVSSFIISQSPIVTVLLAIFFLGERINLLRVFGLLLSVVGVALISYGEIGGFKWDMGIVYLLIATLTSGLYSIWQKPLLRKYNAIDVTTYIIWGGTLFLAIYMHKLQHDLAHASLKATLMVVYLGIFPAALGYMAWSYALIEISASRAVTFLYFMPFLATLLGWIGLNEIPMLLSLLGGVIAIFGVLFVNKSYRLSQKSEFT